MAKAPQIKITGGIGRTGKIGGDVFKGAAQMKKLLNEYAVALGPEGLGTKRKEIKTILIGPAVAIRNKARELAPIGKKAQWRGTGKSEKSIRRLVQPGVLRANIYARRNADNEPGVTVGVNRKEAFYAHMVERGTSKWPGHPFFRPAVTALRKDIARMIAPGMKNLIEGMANEMAYKPQ